MQKRASPIASIDLSAIPTVIQIRPPRVVVRARPRIATRFVAWLPAAALAISAIYAMLRSVSFGGVSIVDVPLFIVNTALALAAVLLLLAMALAPLAARWGLVVENLRRRLAAFVGLFVGLHVGVSLAILRPAYLAAFFAADDTMTGSCQLALLAGLVAGLGMVLLAAPKWRAAMGGVLGPVAGWKAVVIWSVAAHVLIMGLPGWLTPDQWPGFMPPITLIAFVTLVLGAMADRYLERAE